VRDDDGVEVRRQAALALGWCGSRPEVAVPLASDGSLYLQVPADRLLHLQVLDSDRRVVGNQLTLD